MMEIIKDSFNSYKQEIIDEVIQKLVDFEEKDRLEIVHKAQRGAVIKDLLKVVEEKLLEIPYDDFLGKIVLTVNHNSGQDLEDCVRQWNISELYVEKLKERERKKSGI